MATLISYEEFTKSDDYKGFAVVNPEQGSLKVMAFTAYQAIPIENAEVIITKEIGGNNVLFFRGYTDSSGIIDNISLPAPTSGYDDNSFQTSSTTSYKLTAIKDKYDRVKKDHKDEVVLIRVGSFYVTFSIDAMVLNYIFSYQINEGKLGFPRASLDKVCSSLRERSISFYIFEEEGKNYYSRDNLYSAMSVIAEKNYNIKCRNEELLNKVKSSIEKNPDNYDKIKEFIDGIE